MTEARQKYLADASRAIAHTVPAMSAIMSMDLIKMRTGSKVRHKRNESVCEACGNMLVVGWSCRRQRERPQKVVKSTRRNHQAQQEESVARYKCDPCGTINIREDHTESRSRKRPTEHIKGQQTLQRPSPHMLQPTESKQSNSSNEDCPSTTVTSDPSSATAVSKKRNKSRKAGGLLSMLAKSKAANESSGLDLMDFMKAG